MIEQKVVTPGIGHPVEELYEAFTNAIHAWAIKQAEASVDDFQIKLWVMSAMGNAIAQFVWAVEANAFWVLARIASMAHDALAMRAEDAVAGRIVVGTDKGPPS